MPDRPSPLFMEFMETLLREMVLRNTIPDELRMEHGIDLQELDAKLDDIKWIEHPKIYVDSPPLTLNG